jgi:hypothetical protein
MPIPHPSWCEPDLCSVPDRPNLGSVGGAHYSRTVDTPLDVTMRGETGPVQAYLMQPARHGTHTWLEWSIGGTDVGHARLADLEALGWLIADGLADERGDDEPASE